MTSNDVKQISIRLQPDGFSYSGQFHAVLPGADFIQRLEEALLDALQNEEANNFDCTVETTRYAIIPAEADNTLAKQMYQLCQAQPETEEDVLMQNAGDQQFRIAFGIDHQLYTFLQRNLGQVTFTHPLVWLYDTWTGRQETEADCMIVEASEKAINLLIYKNGRLHTAHRSNVSGTDNQTYYVMNLWTLNNLDVIEHKIYLQNATNELQNQLSQYIKQCES